MVRGANAKALAKTLAALRLTGRLEKVDEALVQACKSMADQLDVKASNAMLWRVYREALEGLIRDDGDSPEISKLLADLQADPRDPPPR